MVQSRKIVCTKLSTDFRACTAIAAFQVPALKHGDVLVQVKYCGINASDINYTNGTYFLSGVEPPFDCGFEALGTVLDVGPGVEKLQKDDAVVFASAGAFAEHLVTQERRLIKVPAAVPEVLPIVLCGLTASIALEHVGELTHGETVMVTAAAGATGQVAVQLAKLAGNHVIGTCSSPEKVVYLRSIGCDRPINYREENVHDVLQKEYPRGVDLVFESVGGAMFETCVDNIARKGRIIVVGAIAGYQDSSTWKHKASKTTMPLPSKLLTKAASVRGFLYTDYSGEAPSHTKKLATLVQRGVLTAGVDPSDFYGLEGIADAIDHMYERKNIGKVVVNLTKGAAKL